MSSPFFEPAGALWRPEPCGAPPGLRRMQARAGQGWVQAQALGQGVALGRLSCHLAQPLCEQFECPSESVRLMLLVRGRQCVRLAGGAEVQVQAGDVLVRPGNPGPLCHIAPAQQPLASVALDVPRAYLAALCAGAADGLGPAALGLPGRCTALRPRGSLAAALLARGQRLLAAGPAQGALALLELQAQGLALLHCLLTGAASPVLPAQGSGAAARWQRALDEALHILHEQWDQPHTIASLARRAGMNECYLKALFRQRTGMTIAAYLRQLRMGHARQLIESGQATVQQAALACGYARSDKFAQAFARVHGLRPSQL